MLKKAFFLATLLVFSIPNISYTQGDECSECMEEAGYIACIGCVLFCCIAAEQDKGARRIKVDYSVSALRQMGGQETAPKDKNV